MVNPATGQARPAQVFVAVLDASARGGGCFRWDAMLTYPTSERLRSTARSRAGPAGLSVGHWSPWRAVLALRARWSGLPSRCDRFFMIPEAESAGTLAETPRAAVGIGGAPVLRPGAWVGPLDLRLEFARAKWLDVARLAASAARAAAMAFAGSGGVSQAGRAHDTGRHEP